LAAREPEAASGRRTAGASGRGREGLISVAWPGGLMTVITERRAPNAGLVAD